LGLSIVLVTLIHLLAVLLRTIQPIVCLWGFGMQVLYCWILIDFPTVKFRSPLLVLASGETPSPLVPLIRTDN
jgi:membrane-bound metal-dependent hydrolase YbcI (DUF457 family)